MKTTIELPDDLMVAAKKRAAEARSTLRELQGRRGVKRSARTAIRWVTVEGGLPPGLDLADRAAMSEWLQRAE